MIYKFLALFVGVTITTATPSGLQLLFAQEHKQYQYELKVNVSSGTMSPSYSESCWTLQGKLGVLVYDNFTKARFNLDELKAEAFSEHLGYSGFTSEEAAKYLKEIWEVEYKENGFVSSIYVGAEPVWATNIKRAISINFQLRKETGTYTKEEPCLYDSCVMTYIVKGNNFKKYNSLRLTYATERRWSSVPDIWTPDYITDTITTAEREYKLDEAKGLESLDLTGSFQYKIHNHILYVSSELSLYYVNETPVPSVGKLQLTKTPMQYVAHDFNDPSNSIRNRTQSNLKIRTYELLLKISRKGIDTNPLVINASMIHSLDFIELLNIMSQLTYESLLKLFEEMVLGTSYDVETSRNIFLEVLPHVRTKACALFVKYLVMKQKDNLEDSTVLSLIRKLPFNIASHSQELLEALEEFTKLGLDFDQETRHAAILSFATLVYKTMEAKRVKQDYFDNIVVKYFRMYSDCPQYIDRLVWLQGLCNMGFSAEAYTRTIYGDNTRDRHERLWSVLAGGQSMAMQYTVLEMTLPVLMDENEHILLRISALHTFLSSEIHASDFVYVHDYIKNSNNMQLKRFWFSTVKSLSNNKLYNGYRSASYFVPFVLNQITNPGSTYWATNNYIVTTMDEHPASLQVFSVGDALTSLPTLVGLKLSTGGRRPHHVSVYVLAEGVSETTMLRALPTEDPNVLNIDRLIELLKKLKVTVVDPQKVHIDVIVQIHDKTVYATHFNQTRIENLSADNVKKSMQDFLRFGSHINQQMVYYPLQRDVNIPTELGTPIRLQTTVMSFTSLRGNLTATPGPETMTWKNDMNLRYQATAVTALSTDAPILQSEHVALIQQSLAGYLTMKFDAIFSLSALEIHWPNPGLHHGSLAMHSRSQIMLITKNETRAYTIRKGKDEGEVNDTAIFFDCEQPMSSAQVIEELSASKKKSFDLLASLKPSLILLNAIVLLARPSSGPCGVILPPRWMTKTNENLVMEAKMSFKNWLYMPSNLARLRLESSIILRNQSDRAVFFNVTWGTELKENGYNKLLRVLMVGHQPSAVDPDRRKWRMSMLNNETSALTLKQELANIQATLEGIVSVNLTLGDNMTIKPTQMLLVEYKGIPKEVDGVLERHFEIKVVPNLGLIETIIDKRAALGTIINYIQETLNVTAVLKERNGVATLSINNGPDTPYESENLVWFLDQWETLPFLQKFGLYRECRIQSSLETVQTFMGATEWLPPNNCSMNLALGDCTNTPRFAVVRVKDGGIRVYMGGYYIIVQWKNGVPLCTTEMGGQSATCSDVNTPSFRLAVLDDTVAVICTVTSIAVFHYQNEETMIFIPHYYMNTVCGECATPHNQTVC